MNLMKACIRILHFACPSPKSTYKEVEINYKRYIYIIKHLNLL